MSVFLFGEDSEIHFWPMREVANLEAGELTESSILDSYLFGPDTVPSIETAAAGTGAVQTLASAGWSANTSGGFKHALDVVNDPDPSNPALYKRSYFLAVNFRLQAAAQIQTAIREVYFQRATVRLSDVSINAAYLTARVPTLGELASGRLSNFLAPALDELKLDLEEAGAKFDSICNVDKLDLALCYKAIELVSDDLIRKTGDRHDRRRKAYEDKYIKVLPKIRLLVDTNKDGKADTERKAKQSFQVIF